MLKIPIAFVDFSCCSSAGRSSVAVAGGATEGFCAGRAGAATGGFAAGGFGAVVLPRSEACAVDAGVTGGFGARGVGVLVCVAGCGVGVCVCVEAAGGRGGAETVCVGVVVSVDCVADSTLAALRIHPASPKTINAIKQIRAARRVNLFPFPMPAAPLCL